MATPAVAGLVAYSLNIVGRGTAPAEMSEYITQLATENALGNIRKRSLSRVVFFLLHSSRWSRQPF